MSEENNTTTGENNLPEIKQDPSLNATKHGVLAKTLILPSESESDFNQLMTETKNSFDCSIKPVEFLVEDLVISFWRLRRIYKGELDLFYLGGSENYGNFFLIPDATYGGKPIESLSRYETSLKKHIFKTIDKILEIQKANK
ncbi:MAG: hypothetical protein ABIF17_03445 [Patescibacteria group bacterium]